MRKKKKMDGISLTYFALVGIAELCSTLSGQIEPAAIQTAKADARKQRADDKKRAIINRFVSDRIHTAPGERTRAKEIYEDYLRWHSGPEPALSRKAFGTFFTELYPKTKDGIIYYEGLKIVD